MHAVPLIRSAALGPLLDHLARIGASSHRLLGSQLATLPDVDVLLPLSAGGRAYERASLQLGSSALGLRVGESTRLERVPLGELLRTSRSLGAALAALVHEGPRYNTGLRFRLAPDGDDVWLHLVLASSLTHGRQQVRDLVAALLLSLVRRAAGPSWRPAEMRYEGPPPPHAEELAALACGRVSFGNANSAFPIPWRLLALPLPEPEPVALRAHAARALVPSSDPLRSLSQTVDTLLRLGESSVGAAAEAAGVSVRTLQRHLRGLGIRFADLVQQARFDAATRMLADPRMKVIEVSAALGYTDSANFTRAFRRWTGLSPRAFRRAAAELPVLVTRVTSAAGSTASLPIG